MTRVPRPLLVAFAAITATGFAACGGDDDTGAPAGGTNSTSATTSATSPAATPDPFRDYAALSYPVDLVDGHSIGKADAPVTLTLYEDFQCPFCLQLTLAYEAGIWGGDEGTATLASNCAFRIGMVQGGA